MNLTVTEAYKLGYNKLTEAGISDARIDTGILLNEIFGVDKGFILAHGDMRLSELNGYSEEKIDDYLSKLDRRSKREPIQHIIGHSSFMGLDFEVDSSVLIPRQDTEILVEEVLKDIHDGMHFLDMCTGSGCILDSIINYTNGCTAVGVDISKRALEVAKRNTKRLLKETSFSEASDRIRFINSNIYDEINEKFDIIVSNPPYIETEVINTLEPEVKDFDPVIALDGGEDGLYFYQKIISGAPRFLKFSGMIFLEIGYNQAQAVTRLLKDNNFGYIEVIKDYAGLDRVVKARYEGTVIDL